MFDLATKAVLVAQPNETAWYWWDHTGWHSGMGFHLFFWLAVVLLITGIILALLRLSATRAGAANSTAAAILDDRYARGEIDRGEYLERRRDIS